MSGKEAKAKRQGNDGQGCVYISGIILGIMLVLLLLVVLLSVLSPRF